MNLVLQQRTASTTCVVCRDALGVLAVCRGCGVTTHAGCAAERRGCPTIGCARRDALPVARMTEQHVDLRAARPAAPAKRSLTTSRERLAALAARRVPVRAQLLALAITAVAIAALSWLAFRRLP